MNKIDTFIAVYLPSFLHCFSSSLLSQTNSSVNSPRRTRKWFGLFTKTSKSSNMEDTAGSSSSHSVYTKKNHHSPHQPLRREISGPTRSQSEYRLHDIQRQQEKQQRETIVRRSESFSSTTSDRSSLLSISQQNVNMTAPLATPESEYEINLSDADSISLMSAIVSVTAKYINLDDSQRYMSPPPLCSTTPPAATNIGSNSNLNAPSLTSSVCTVGEPSDFRRLGDDELLVEPPATTTITQTMDTQPVSSESLESPVMDSPPGQPLLAPYSSHRRGAPSNDSGYLSQASTLNRPSVASTFTEQFGNLPPSPQLDSCLSSGGDVFSSPVFNSNNSSYTDTGDGQYDYGNSSPSANPFSSEQRKSLRNSGRTKRTNTGDDMPVKRIRSLSPDTYSVNVATATTTDNTTEKSKPLPEEDICTKSPPGLANSTNGIKDVEKMEPPMTRPSTLNVIAHCVNTTESSFSSPSDKYKENRAAAAAGPDSMISRLTRSKSIGTPVKQQKQQDNVVTTPASPLQETVFGPRELFYQESNSDKQQQDATRSSSPQTSARSAATTSSAKTPTRTHFSFTRSQSLSARAELRRRNYNNSAGGSPSSSFDKSITSPSSSFNNKSMNDSTDAPPVVLRHAKSRDNIRSSSRGRADSARRLSVRERAAAFGQVTTSPMTSPCRTSWNERAYESFDGGDRRSGSNTPTNRGSRNSSRVDNDRSDDCCASGESVDSNPLAPRRRYSNSNSNSCNDVSAKEFDLRCRVDERKQITPPSSRYHSTSRLDSTKSIDISRSTDRLVRASHQRRNDHSSRPKSEVIARFEFRSFDNHKIEEPVRSYSLSRNIEKEQLNEHEPHFKSSKSENRSSGKKIGNFPLTLRTGGGSAHNSRVSVDGNTNRSTTRPRSMYENERKSIYDNERRSLYDNVSYEMV